MWCYFRLFILFNFKMSIFRRRVGASFPHELKTHQLLQQPIILQSHRWFVSNTYYSLHYHEQKSGFFLTKSGLNAINPHVLQFRCMKFRDRTSSKKNIKDRGDRKKTGFPSSMSWNGYKMIGEFRNFSLFVKNFSADHEQIFWLITENMKVVIIVLISTG